jgi:hypothetical protein
MIDLLDKLPGLLDTTLHFTFNLLLLTERSPTFFYSSPNQARLICNQTAVGSLLRFLKYLNVNNPRIKY